MRDWPDRRLLDLLKLEIPIIQAPMAGSDSVALARSVSSTGALGSLACALLSPGEVREAASAIRQGVSRPFNLNFFCHTMEAPDTAAEERWKSFLKSHYEGFGLDIEAVRESRLRLPFDEEMRGCGGGQTRGRQLSLWTADSWLDGPAQEARYQSVVLGDECREARWVEDRGCDAAIVQGFEAGGHRAMFLETNVATQVGLFALLPQVADALSIPVIAAGGIANARGIVAAFALGASGVQMGTAYLFCPEANVSTMYRQALETASDTGTAVTNLFSGRHARGILNRYLRDSGLISEATLAFPYARTLIAPLRAASEKTGSLDYMQLWAGQAAGLVSAMPADEFTRKLAADALSRL